MSAKKYLGAMDAGERAEKMKELVEYIASPESSFLLQEKQHPERTARGLLRGTVTLDRLRNDERFDWVGESRKDHRPPSRKKYTIVHPGDPEHFEH